MRLVKVQERAMNVLIVILATGVKIVRRRVLSIVRNVIWKMGDVFSAKTAFGESFVIYNVINDANVAP